MSELKHYESLYGSDVMAEPETYRGLLNLAHKQADLIEKLVGVAKSYIKLVGSKPAKEALAEAKQLGYGE